MLAGACHCLGSICNEFLPVRGRNWTHCATGVQKRSRRPGHEPLAPADSSNTSFISESTMLVLFSYALVFSSFFSWLSLYFLSVPRCGAYVRQSGVWDPCLLSCLPQSPHFPTVESWPRCSVSRTRGGSQRVDPW